MTQHQCETDAIHNWIVFTMGCFQHEGGASEFEKLHRKVSKVCNGPHTVVALRSWRDSIVDMARRIDVWKNSVAPRIVLVGYSYGGWSSVQLAQELQAFNLSVESLCLVDPVGRIFGALPTVFSMLDVFPLYVPSNVKNLYSWRQVRDRPRGGRIVLEKRFAAPCNDKVNAGTLWHDNETFQFVRHVNMDNVTEIKERIMQVACGRAA